MPELRPFNPVVDVELPEPGRDRSIDLPYRPGKQLLAVGAHRRKQDVPASCFLIPGQRINVQDLKIGSPVKPDLFRTGIGAFLVIKKDGRTGIIVPDLPVHRHQGIRRLEGDNDEHDEVCVPE